MALEGQHGALERRRVEHERLELQPADRAGDVETRGLIHTSRPLIHTAKRGAETLLGVQQLAQRVDVPAEVVVLAHLALDLLAAVEDGRVVAATEGLADP